MDAHDGLIDAVLDPAPARDEARPEAKPVPDRLATGWAVLIGVGWPVALTIAAVLEPTPVDPDTAISVVADVTWFGVMIGLWATAFAAAKRHPSAAVGGTVVGVLAVVLSVLCPVSGHHGVGLWWVGQLGVLATMLAVSLAGLRGAARATS